MRLLAQLSQGLSSNPSVCRVALALLSARLREAYRRIHYLQVFFAVIPTKILPEPERVKFFFGCSFLWGFEVPSIRALSQ